MRSQLRRVTGPALAVVLMAGIVHTATIHQQGQNSRSSGAPSDRIVANDNRIPAGTLADSTLTVRLEARVGQWHPDGHGNPGVAVKACRFVGPTIRVRPGRAAASSGELP